MKSTDYELSGLVKSCGWRRLTLTSSVARGGSNQLFNNDYYKKVNSLYGEIASANAGNAGIQGAIGVGSLIGSVLTTATATMAAGSVGFSATAGNVVNNFSDVAGQTAGLVTAIATKQIYKEEANKLEVEGTLISNRPPDVKFATVDVYGDYAYTFFVRTTSISDNDRQKADEFFTAYGYNVEGKFLNSVSQLNCRQLFTYIKADDVMITSISDVTSFKRYKDEQSVSDVKDRFNYGLRIWQSNPNYNWANITNGVKK
jgi:hypothetical protein